MNQFSGPRWTTCAPGLGKGPLRPGARRQSRPRTPAFVLATTAPAVVEDPGKAPWGARRAGDMLGPGGPAGAAAGARVHAADETRARGRRAAAIPARALEPLDGRRRELGGIDVLVPGMAALGPGLGRTWPRGRIAAGGLDAVVGGDAPGPRRSAEPDETPPPRAGTRSGLGSCFGS